MERSRIRSVLGICIVLAVGGLCRIASQGGLDHVRVAGRVQPQSVVAKRIVEGAKRQYGTVYNASYRSIRYPNGDVPSTTGACTDVVIRALRAAGHDLQSLIHEDMRQNFAAYPRKWNLDAPNTNIDHRRVPNQMKFFERHGLSLPLEVNSRTLATWQPGDIVCWSTGQGRTHTGIVSDGYNSSGVPLVIHNNGLCMEDDCLTRWPIIGHYRFPTTGPNKSNLL